MDAVLVEILIILLRRQRGIWRPAISLADHRQTVSVSSCPSEHLTRVLQLYSCYGVVSLWQLYMKCHPGIEAQDKADHLSEKWTTSRGRVINLLAIYKTSAGWRIILITCPTVEREECLTGINWGLDECEVVPESVVGDLFVRCCNGYFDESRGSCKELIPDKLLDKFLSNPKCTHLWDCVLSGCGGGCAGSFPEDLNLLFTFRLVIPALSQATYPDFCLGLWWLL